MIRKTLTILSLIGLVFGAGVAYFVLSGITWHAGETVILLMPFAFAGLLWSCFPSVRRSFSWWQYASYPLILTPIAAVALYIMATVARGRVLWFEIVLGVYFIIVWRMAWAVWARTVGQLGERYRRWGRRARRSAGGLWHITEAHKRKWAVLAMLVSPIRFCLVLFVFVPLAAGSLVHRIKIGNRTDLVLHEFRSMEVVSFRTEDGLTLSGWFLPDGNSDATVVICHGLGANKGNFVDYMNVFHGRGYNTLIFDFRGHGDSDGHTSTFGLYESEDVQAAVDWLKSQRPQQARQVFGWGSSMGAVALVRAASQDDRIEAVVLDSCFASAPMLAEHHLGKIPLGGAALGRLVLSSLSLHAGRSFWNLDASSAISQLSPRPVFLIHGQQDVVIPPSQLSLLYEHAREPKSKWLAPGKHSNIMSAGFAEYQQRVLSFLESARSDGNALP